MIKIAMVLGHDLLIPNEDIRVYREAVALINDGHEVSCLLYSGSAEEVSKGE